MWASIAALGVYVMLGSSRRLSLGPESTTALLTATPSRRSPRATRPDTRGLAAALAGLVGVACLLGRLARLGFLADLLSRPVLVGYLAGVALFMIGGQLQNVTGVPVDGRGFLNELASFAAPTWRATSWPRSSGSRVGMLLAPNLAAVLAAEQLPHLGVPAAALGTRLPRWHAGHRTTSVWSDATALTFPSMPGPRCCAGLSGRTCPATGCFRARRLQPDPSRHVRVGDKTLERRAVPLYPSIDRWERLAV